MGYNVNFAASAHCDIDETVAYLASVLKEPTAANELLSAIDETVDNLEQFPHMYPVVDDPRLNKLGYRKALCCGYVLVYRVAEQRVMVMRLFHQRQDYAKLL